MTISDVLALVDDLKPNEYDETAKIRWLSELDGRVFNDIVLIHEHEMVEDEDGNLVEPTFTAYDDENQELLIPDTYADTYRHYIGAQIDYSNGETDRYQNSMIMFNSSYQEYTNWYNRTHKPIQKQLKVF